MRGSRNFCQGGGVQALLPENSSDNVFFPFFSPQLILKFYRGLLMVYFRENYNFSRFQTGSNIFQGGGGVHHFPEGPNFFQWGLNANLYRKPYNL